MKTVEEINECRPITTCDEADEIAEWTADMLGKVFRKSQARFAVYCTGRIGELLGTRLLSQRTAPLTLSVIDAATKLIMEIDKSRQKEAVSDKNI